MFFFDRPASKAAEAPSSTAPDLIALPRLVLPADSFPILTLPRRKSALFDSAVLAWGSNFDRLDVHGSLEWPAEERPFRQPFFYAPRKADVRTTLATGHFGRAAVIARRDRGADVNLSSVELSGARRVIGGRGRTVSYRACADDAQTPSTAGAHAAKSERFTPGTRAVARRDPRIP